MSESREHRAIVSSLAVAMATAGIRIVGVEAPGWPSAPMIGTRRPDVFGRISPRAEAVIGEAKRGPELWACARQIEELALALPGYGPAGAGALVIVDVPSEWVTSAETLLDHLQLGRTAALVWAVDVKRPVRAEAA
jgi:hypothetical protein